MAGASATMKLALHMLILSIAASHHVLAAAQQHTINVQSLLSSEMHVLLSTCNSRLLHYLT
jgi:hypothetical protein